MNRAVFALFRAEVRIIDHAKRAALQKLLLENVTSTAPGEKLDEKLAALTFSSDDRDRKSRLNSFVDAEVFTILQCLHLAPTMRHGGMTLVSRLLRIARLTFAEVGQTDHPNGIVVPLVRNGSRPRASTNPFDSSDDSSLSSSPSSSEEELYHALTLQTPILPAQPATITQRRPAPPPPARASKPTTKDTPDV